MADTLVWSASLAGKGVAAPVSDIAWSYCLVVVTNRGVGRTMDQVVPSRLFEVGWLSVGNLGPSPHTEVFQSEAIFIEWDSFLLPAQWDFSFVNEYYLHNLTYQLNTTAAITVEFWHV